MTNKKYKSISISNLIINPDNDRFESVENEKQAIDIMLTKLGDKIYYIAIHILENGLSPKPFYVMPSKKSNKKLWGIERSGFFNGREKWAKDFENQRV